MTSKQDNDSQIQADTLRAAFIKEDVLDEKSNREKFIFFIIEKNVLGTYLKG